MRKALPLLLLVVLGGLAFLAWQKKWFVGSDRTDASESAGLAPSEIEGRGDLKGAAAFRPEDADPKTFEGDPVGKLKLAFGTSSITGRVLSTAATPIRFARVTVVLPPPDGGHSVRTTKDGTFEIQGLAALEFDLHASAEGFVSRSVRTPALAVGQATAVGDITLKVKSPAKEGLSVKVVEEASGRPVAGAKVIASTLNYGLIVTLGAEKTGTPDVIERRGVTDDNGVCEMNGLSAEKYDVVVDAKGYVLEPIDNVVIAAGRVEHLSVPLKPGLSIQGTVVDADGLPAADAFVTGLGFPSFRSYASVKTSSSGSFTLDGLSPGAYWLFSGSDTKGAGSAQGVKAGERAARIQLKGVGTLVGKVVAKGGGPVTDFLFRPYTGDPFVYVYSRPYHVKDEGGKFSVQLPPGSYMIDVKSDGSSVTTTTSVNVTPNQTTEVTIELPPEGIVKGVITDPEGNHLAGAEIFVKSGGFPPMPIREKYARADADGQFVLKGMALEPVKLHVRHAAYATTTFETMPAEPSTAKEVVVKLNAGALVEGHVTTIDGAPVGGQRVNLSQGFDFFGAKTVFTDDAGAFAFRAIAEGDYQCSIGRYENNANGQQKGVSVPVAGAVTVDFQTAGDKEGRGTITGTVTIGGKPATGAKVIATDARGEASGITTETDAQGRFVAKGLNAGDVRIRVETAQGNFRSASGRIEKAGGSTVIDVALGSSRVEGVLIGSDGKVTVSGAWVSAEIAEGDQGGWERVRGSVTSGNEGQFSFQGLEPGTYRLRITGSMGGNAAKLTDPFALAKDETKDLGRIQLAAGGGITGRVTNEAGSPIEGVGVSIENSRGEPVLMFSLSSTGSDGRYSLPGIEFGTYTVVFDKAGFAPARKAATISGAGGATADVVLKGGGALSVSVEDENGQPVEGARIELFENGKRVEKTLSIANLFESQTSMTGKTGAATIADLAPSVYVVKAVKDGTNPMSDWPSVTVASGGTVTVKIVLRKGT